MRVWVTRWTWGKTAVTVLMLSAVAAGLLGFPEASATGMRRGLSLCAEKLIPSLFPFLVLSGVIARVGLCERIGAHLHGLTRRLFGLPDVCAAGLLIGFIGGYPAGASVTAALVRGGRITREEGRHMLRFCVNGGPAFLIGTVGVGLLGSPVSGMILLAAHWGASLCIGWMGHSPSRPPNDKDKHNQDKDAGLANAPSPTLPSPPPLSLPPSPLPTRSAAAQPLSAAWVEAVNESALALIGMSGFVALAASLLSVLDAMGTPDAVTAVVSGITEVSLGSMSVIRSGALMPFWLGLILGWGGLSVHGQIAVIAAPQGLMSRDFIIARLQHGLLAGSFSWLLFRVLPFSPVAAVSAPVVRPFAASSFTGGVALLGLCAVWLLTVRRSNEPA